MAMAQKQEHYATNNCRSCQNMSGIERRSWKEPGVSTEKFEKEASKRNPYEVEAEYIACA